MKCKGSSLQVADRVAGSLTKSVHSESTDIADGACWCNGKESKETDLLTVCLNQERIFLT